MSCHLYIKGIYIILIEYFYYYIHSRTDPEKYTKEKAQGAIYYFHSSDGDSFIQCISKGNKIHMRNISKYTSNCLCVSKTGIITGQSVLSVLQVFFKEWRIFIASVNVCVFTITLLVLENGFPLSCCMKALAQAVRETWLYWENWWCPKCCQMQQCKQTREGHFPSNLFQFT